jgi:hypothetical protein
MDIVLFSLKLKDFDRIPREYRSGNRILAEN